MPAGSMGLAIAGIGVVIETCQLFAFVIEKRLICF